MTIKIAVAGHTNAGKTTLIRTLTRSKVGKVVDLPNVSEGEIYYYPGLQANFIDTAGFVKPSLLLLHLKGVSLPEEEMEKLKYDLKAIEFIEKSDVAIYLGDLSITAESNHEEEMEIVKKFQPKTIAILNQYNKYLRGSNLEEVNHRCHQWTKVLNQKGIAHVIIFDAHWDRRSKEKDIYDAIYEILDDNQKVVFLEGLEKFKKRQQEIRDEVAETLAETVENLQEIVVNVKKSEYNEGECREKIARLIYKRTIKFIAYISMLYEVAAEYPTDSTEDLIFKTRQKVSVPDRLVITTGASAFLGGISAIFGGIIGAVITGALGGPLTIIPGALEGAKIFGTVGAALGSLAVFSDSEDRVNVAMTSKEIEDTVKGLLAMVWGLEHNGFGRDKVLSEDEAKNMKSLVEELHAEQKIDDWTKVNRGRVLNYCKHILNDLESY